MKVLRKKIPSTGNLFAAIFSNLHFVNQWAFTDFCVQCFWQFNKSCIRVFQKGNFVTKTKKKLGAPGTCIGDIL